jgi:hypothetical protein
MQIATLLGLCVRPGYMFGLKLLRIIVPVNINCIVHVWLIPFVGAFAKLRKPAINFVMCVCLSVCPSVRPQNSSAATGRIFMKFDSGEFFENQSRKFKSHYNLKIITRNFT